MERAVKQGALFLDRDQTIIAAAPKGLPSPAAHAPDHVAILEGVVEGLKRARAAGLLLVVVTNQPGPAKGQYRHQDVVATNARMSTLLADAGVPLDAIYACEHHPVGGPGGDPALIRVCDCRKPKAGMITQAARDLDLDLARSALIGDVETDVQAAHAAGIPGFRVGPALSFGAAVDQALRAIGASSRSSA